MSLALNCAAMSPIYLFQDVFAVVLGVGCALGLVLAGWLVAWWLVDAIRGRG